MKYKNIRQRYDGKVFDSKKESRRYAELKLLERTGEIKNLRTQVPFQLLKSQHEGGKCIERGVKYIADFVYEHGDRTVVEDTKSPATRTKDYIIKRKLMLERHGIRIKEDL